MNKIIIGIAGEIASGKSTIADLIKSEYGGEALKFSAPLRDVLVRLGIPETRENLQSLSTKLREVFGQDLLSRALFFDVKKSSSPLVYIDGVRRISDVNLFKNLDGFILIYVDTPFDLRYKRITERSENLDDANKVIEEFKRENESESEQMIKDLKKYANYIVDNSGTLEELQSKVKEITKRVLI